MAAQRARHEDPLRLLELDLRPREVELVNYALQKARLAEAMVARRPDRHPKWLQTDRAEEILYRGVIRKCAQLLLHIRGRPNRDTHGGKIRFGHLYATQRRSSRVAVPLPSGGKLPSNMESLAHSHSLEPTWQIAP